MLQGRDNLFLLLSSQQVKVTKAAPTVSRRLILKISTGENMASKSRTPYFLANQCLPFYAFPCRHRSVLQSETHFLLLADATQGRKRKK